MAAEGNRHWGVQSGTAAVRREALEDCGGQSLVVEDRSEKPCGGRVRMFGESALSNGDSPVEGFRGPKRASSDQQLNPLISGKACILCRSNHCKAFDLCDIDLSSDTSVRVASSPAVELRVR